MPADSVTRFVDIAAPRDKVWHALTDPQQFGTWFRVALDGPFRVGDVTTGAMTYPGHEGAPWRSITEVMIAPTRLAFRWRHEAAEAADAAGAPGWTHVDFRLDEAGPARTRVTVTESGFAALPPDYRDTALRRNAEGWTIQLGNLDNHVTA